MVKKETLLLLAGLVWGAAGFNPPGAVPAMLTGFGALCGVWRCFRAWCSESWFSGTPRAYWGTARSGSGSGSF